MHILLLVKQNDKSSNGFVCKKKKSVAVSMYVQLKY